MFRMPSLTCSLHNQQYMLIGFHVLVVCICLAQDVALLEGVAVTVGVGLS